MKQWKLVLVALLSVLLVCTCMSALADTPTPTPAPHEHTWEKVSYVPPTCTKDGYNNERCSCGETRVNVFHGTALGHNYNQPVEMTKKKATCTEDGYTVWACGNGCGTEIGRTIEKALGHNFVKDYENHYQAPGCLTNGWVTEICTRCFTEGAKHNLGYANGTMNPGHVKGMLVGSEKATCGASGWQQYACKNCGLTNLEALKVTVPATGAHTWGSWSTKVADGGLPATCTTDGVRIRFCTNTDCNYRNVEGAKASQKEIVKALGHKYKTTTEPASCAKEGKKVTTCENGCGYNKVEVLKKLDHNLVDVIIHPAFCKDAGLKDQKCTVCGQTINKNVVIPALGHKGKWVVTKAATPKDKGVKELICQNLKSDGQMCREVLDKKDILYSEMMYNNTLAGFGPCTRDLIGGKTWNRVTPVDLSVDGTYTYDLVASNKYVVGTLVVTVANGTVTVNYELNANQIKVNEETLTLYANLEALKNGTGLTATVGTPIDIAANFGEDTKVIVAFAAKADYNAVGAGVASFKADEAKLAALIALID